MACVLDVSCSLKKYSITHVPFYNEKGYANPLR